MSLQETLADIHALEEELLEFERKYGLRAETLYAAYMSGEEPEDDTTHREGLPLGSRTEVATFANGVASSEPAAVRGTEGVAKFGRGVAK